MMKRIQVKTHIEASDFKKVFSAFDEKLFLYLTKSAPVKPIDYQGGEIGDEIHLLLTFPWKSKWVSKITEVVLGETEAFFVDEGIVLPFGLTFWSHKHIVRKVSDTIVEIEDLITLDTKYSILTWFFYQIFKVQFLGRKKDYKRYFVVEK